MTVSRRKPPSIPDPDAPRVVRLCLDLNVWCAAYLADKHGRRDTASARLTEIAREGKCSLGPTQLVVSWGMIDRLREVFERNRWTDPAEPDLVVSAIVSYASVGPVGIPPYLVIGGTEVIPLDDDEDVHVLETAIAGDADILATSDFDDFITYRTRIIEPGRIAVFEGPRKSLLIAHPFVVAAWEREGRIPDFDLG